MTPSRTNSAFARISAPALSRHLGAGWRTSPASDPHAAQAGRTAHASASSAARPRTSAHWATLLRSFPGASDNSFIVPAAQFSVMGDAGNRAIERTNVRSGRGALNSRPQNHRSAASASACRSRVPDYRAAISSLTVRAAVFLSFLRVPQAAASGAGNDVREAGLSQTYMSNMPITPTQIIGQGEWK